MNRWSQLLVLGLVALVFVTGGEGSARAQGVGPGEGFGADPGVDQIAMDGGAASVQRFALEMKFGPYRPQVDNEFGGRATPYQDVYGSASHFLMQGELDWQLWHDYGSLAIAGQLGYVSQTANAFTIDPKTGKPTSMRSPVDMTEFSILPVAALAVYRFDVPWLYYQIPLVPYIKLGPAYDFWWVTDGTGAIATDGKGGHALGGSFGWEGAIGVGILLDWADPEAAFSLDQDLGINHTYIDLELVHSSVNDFGISNGLNVGDDTWNVGLAFEF